MVEVLEVLSNTENTSYTLYDTNGKLIVKGHSKELSFFIECSALQAGSYILELKSPSGDRSIEQIIKID